MTIDASKVRYDVDDSYVDFTYGDGYYVDFNNVDGQGAFTVGVTVDARGLSRVITVDGVRLNVTFKNVELTNGADDVVGGLYANGAVTVAPTITFERGKITNNVGGGAYIGEGSVLYFTESVASGNTNGAGLAGDLNSNLQIVDSYVFNNANVNGYGGGVSSPSGVARIIRSDVFGNTAKVGAGVFAAHVETDRATITNNKAVGANGAGGALVVVSSAKLTNTLVADNQATDPAVFGGVVALRNARVEAYNATIVNNGVDLRGYIGSNFDLYNTIVALGDDAVELDAKATANAYNTLSSFVGWADSQNAYEYNGEEIFVAAAAGNYRLSGANVATVNQAVNSGANDYVAAANGYSVGVLPNDFQGDFVDLDGAKRIDNIVDNLGERVGVVDLGAYESTLYREKPSIVVTTLEDVVNPYDGWISLREAVEEYFHYGSLADGSVDVESRYYDPEAVDPGYTVTFDLADYFAQIRPDVDLDNIAADDLTIHYESGKHHDQITAVDSMTIDASTVILAKEYVDKVDENGKPIYVLVDGDPQPLLDANGELVYRQDVDGEFVPVYQYDENGKLLLDENGDPIPVYAKYCPNKFLGYLKTDDGALVLDEDNQPIPLYESVCCTILTDSEENPIYERQLEYQKEQEPIVTMTTGLGITVDADSESRVMAIEGAKLEVNFIDITLTGGVADKGAGLCMDETETTGSTATITRGGVVDNNGGGVYLGAGSNLVVMGADISRNWNGAGVTGGLNSAIYAYGANFAGNKNNVTSGDYDSDGFVKNLYGGAISAGNATVTVENSTFTENEAGAAGAIYATNLTMANSVVMGNKALENSSNGVGAILVVSNGRLANTLVAQNEASTGVAGVVALRNAKLSLYNDTIVDNGDVDLYAVRGSQVGVYNTIVGLTDGDAEDVERVKATGATISAYNTLSA